MNIIHPRKRRRPAITALVLASTITSLLCSQIGTAATSVNTATYPSAFGELRYESGSRCSTDPQGVEVAYVTDRLIVQTNSAVDATTRINALLDAPAAGAPASLRHGTDASSPTSDGPRTARAVDSIVLPRPDDDLGAIAPVYAFEISGPGRTDLLELTRDLRSEGFAAAPDYAHVLQGGRDFFQPESPPQPWAEAPVARTLTTPLGLPVGTGVVVDVFDSGLAAGDPTTLMANVSTYLPADVEIPDRLVPGIADHVWVGHGRQISSEIAVIAPGATITNARVTREGVSTDFTSAKRIASILNTTPVTTWPNLIVASFTSMACDVDPTVPGDELVPVSLRAVSQTVARLSAQRPGGMAVIAAAGNHGTSRRGYPAAFPSVIAVGALDATLDADGDPMTSTSRTAPVAEYSATGDWIDFYAPGTDLVTLHVDGIVFESVDADGVVSQVTIDGIALSTGTSFAAPYVTGLVAELMSTHHVTVAAAIAALTSSGAAPQQPCEAAGSGVDLGPGVAVALVDRLASSADHATEAAVSVC